MSALGAPQAMGRQWAVDLADLCLRANKIALMAEAIRIRVSGSILSIGSRRPAPLPSGRYDPRHRPRRSHRSHRSHRSQVDRSRRRRDSTSAGPVVRRRRRVQRVECRRRLLKDGRTQDRRRRRSPARDMAASRPLEIVVDRPSI